MNLKELNEQLSKGQLPEVLNFIDEKETNILDWDKVKYNTFYKDRNYIEGLFPQGLRNLEGFDKVIDNYVKQIQEEDIDPLKAYENKRKEETKPNDKEEIELNNNIEL